MILLIPFTGAITYRSNITRDKTNIASEKILEYQLNVMTVNAPKKSEFTAFLNYATAFFS